MRCVTGSVWSCSVERTGPSAHGLADGDGTGLVDAPCQGSDRVRFPGVFLTVMHSSDVFTHM